MIRDERHETFSAYDDNGDHHLITIVTPIRDVASFDEPDATNEGLPRLVTQNGRHVQHINPKEYKIQATETMLYANESRAP